MDENFIGLMSGTSVDSIDAVIVSINDQKITLLDSYSHPIPKTIQEKIWLMNSTSANELETMLELDHQLGELFSDAANTVLNKSSLDKSTIIAIGSHGQTIRHYPNSKYSSTLQIGNANIIVEKTDITTVSDFRRADIAAGGQGAPMVPAFHQYLFQDKSVNRVILNIGGIANVTYLPANNANVICGFDTGPANGLMDEWIQKYQQQAYDNNGDWAKSGTINKSLLNLLLEHPYFKGAKPKSTGRDIFNIAWVESVLTTYQSKDNITPEDVQMTLCALTAYSIFDAINILDEVNEVYVCGGGIHNATLMNLLSSLLSDNDNSIPCQSTEKLGLNPDWVEACAFAWLARQRLNQLPGNCPSVTGAKHPCVLGAVYSPSI